MLTITVILAAIGFLFGLGGLALGGYAYLSTKTAIGDFHALVHRQMPESGGIDARAIRDVAVVRYDALEEMSGARSFSLAILNATGDGVVVSSINGRTESRTYAKTIEGGEASEALSPEEFRAVRSARMGQGPGRTPSRDDRATASPLPDVEAGQLPTPSEDISESGSSVRPLGYAANGEAAQREVHETAR